jgi:hypothetical protein
LAGARNARASFVVLLGILAQLTFSGCVSTRHQMAEENLPPSGDPVVSATDLSLSATLWHVVVFRGPGSWKRDAAWDEYVVELANRGNTTVIFVGARLFDHASFAHAPGSEPLLFEPYVQTRSGEVLERAGNVVAATGRVTAMAAGSFAYQAAAAGGPVVVPVTLGVIALIGSGISVVVPRLIDAVDNKGQRAREGIVEEFDKRSFDCPVVLKPGDVAYGSLFFASGVEAKKLVLRFKLGSGVRDVRMPMSLQTSQGVVPVGEASVEAGASK